MASVDCSYSIKGSGPTIFFVHGIGARKTSWNEVCKYLENDFTCISYDLRGHGDSPKGFLPYSLEDLVNDIVDLLGMREIAICKELTKLNEAVFRGTAIDIYKKIKEKNINLRGEFVVIVSASQKRNKRVLNKKVQMQIIKLLKKYTLTETVRIVHNLTEISKKDIYKAAIEIKNE